MLKGLTINDTGYYESYSANKNDAKYDPAGYRKIATHTSDGKKRNVIDTSNGDLQQQLLSNQTLLIITTMIDSRIDNMVVTYGVSMIKLATLHIPEVITDAVCSNARSLQTSGHVSRTNRDGNTPD